MDHPDSRYAARLTTYGAVSTHLSLLSDRRLGEVVAAATPLGSGIGGRSAELEVGGTRVFVKRVPLTDLEMRPENVRSTANLFGLPMFYQYGVGSAGFGTWRELAVHTMTTNWVLGNEYEGFPLMYHWRVLPDSPPQASPTFSEASTGRSRTGRAPRQCVSGWRPSAGPPAASPSSWNTSRRLLANGWASDGRPLRQARTSRGTRGRRKP